MIDLTDLRRPTRITIDYASLWPERSAAENLEFTRELIKLCFGYWHRVDIRELRIV